MAKEQDMTLTPSKISGVCGRLLCCLKYENEWYQEVKKDMPPIGTIIKTGKVRGRVEVSDPFHNIVKIRTDEGKLVDVRVEDLKKEKKERKKRRSRKSR